jgi:hypothetical protein
MHIRHVRRLGNDTATATHEALDSIAALLDAGLVMRRARNRAAIE